MGQLQDRVAIVTGASSGIGQAVAEMFAQEGAKVVLAARRADKLDTVAAGIAAAGGTALAVPTDVTREADVVALFERAMAAYGRVDLVINNAGIATNTPTDELTLETWQRVLDVNITGPFLCSREAFRIMKPQGGGRIINIGSISAKTARPNSAPYATTKRALEGLTYSMAQDGRAHGITVAIVHPGNTATGFGGGRTGQVSQEGRMKSPDVARLVTLVAGMPADVNLLESVMLPIAMPFLARG